MKNTARKKKIKEVEPVAQLTLADLIRADLREFVIAAGTAAIGAVLEHERTQIVGPRYAHLPRRQAHRAGSAPGELVLGGRRVQVRRPRARTLEGREVELPSWNAFGAEDPLHERAVEQMLVGVSTRSYARSLEPVPDELVTRGTSRSAVSRRFVAATEKQMAEWLGRDLSSIDLVVLMIDGVYVGDATTPGSSSLARTRRDRRSYSPRCTCERLSEEDRRSRRASLSVTHAKQRLSLKAPCRSHPQRRYTRRTPKYSASCESARSLWPNMTTSMPWSHGGRS